MRDFVPLVILCTYFSLGIVHKTLMIPSCPFLLSGSPLLATLETAEDKCAPVCFAVHAAHIYDIYLPVQKSENTEQVQLYENGYKHFCKTVIEEKLLKKQQVFLLSKLDMLFMHAVQERKGVNIATYTRLAHSLKTRLQKSHPCNFKKCTQHSL